MAVHHACSECQLLAHIGVKVYVGGVPLQSVFYDNTLLIGVIARDHIPDILISARQRKHVSLRYRGPVNNILPVGTHSHLRDLLVAECMRLVIQIVGFVNEHGPFRGVEQVELLRDLLKRHRCRIIHVSLTAFTPLRRNEHDTICGARTIDRSSGSILEYLNGLDIGRVNGVQLIRNRSSLLGSDTFIVVRNRKSIDNVKRLTTSGE